MRLGALWMLSVLHRKLRQVESGRAPDAEWKSAHNEPLGTSGNFQKASDTQHSSMHRTLGQACLMGAGVSGVDAVSPMKGAMGM